MISNALRSREWRAKHPGYDKRPYRGTAAQKAGEKRYKASKKGMATNARYLRNLRVLEPHKPRAHDVVKYAVKNGTLVRPKSCRKSPRSSFRLFQETDGHLALPSLSHANTQEGRSMIVFAIDPGTTESAYVQWDEHRVVSAIIESNAKILELLRSDYNIAYDVAAIEMIAHMGMPAGRELFETCVWIGRFTERLRNPRLVYRRDIKMYHCGSARAKDANIRQALIDKYGPPGTKKAPGITYGLKSHLWSAFALATFISETA